MASHKMLWKDVELGASEPLSQRVWRTLNVAVVKMHLTDTVKFVMWA